MKQAPQTYAIALGSNRPHGRYRQPDGVLHAAIDALRALGTVDSVSRIRATPALGPAGRSFANAALILSTELAPVELLASLKVIERRFGRRPGRRWGPRVLDLDIILWSGGVFASRALAIPHPHMARRAFVLTPLAEIAADWPVPRSGRAVRHLARAPVDP